MHILHTHDTNPTMNNKIHQKWIFLLFLFMISTNLVTSQFHCENGNYTSNSTYSANLNTLLSSLPSRIPESGFYNASEGVVSLIFLCRGDLQVETCRSCARDLAIDILEYCPYEKQASLWGELCMLRFSDKSISQRLVVTPGWQAWNWENATSVPQFKADVQTLLFKLRGEAAAGGAVKKVAVGNVTGPDSQAIYGLVQCTPDITEMECSSCIGGAIANLPTCCDWMRSGTIFRPSCNIRYDGTQFYNQTMFQQPPSPLTPEKDRNNSSIMIVVVPICGCVAVAVGICMFLRRRRRKQKPKQQNYPQISSAESLQYDFDTIRDATNDFSEANKLGEGGFGTVYKGKLVDGQEIAVKKLSRISEQADVDFKNEVLLVARLQHRNLVKLFGFCLNNTQRILVYEFLQNASLDHFIFDSTRRQMLDWNTRHKIITGIAKGLVYLHEDSRLKIIHRDLKASNVLLDEDMDPKIADFGLARLFVHDQTHESASRIAGTFGYMAPEYAFHGHFSVKSDVFGFGVLVMEIMSGQKSNHFRDENENVEHLISYAWKNWEAGNAENVIDFDMRNDSVESIEMMMRCIHIALLCVQENPTERPTMASVVHMLSSSAPITSPLSKPGFFLQGRLEATIATNHHSSVSRNVASITDMYPR